MFIPVSVSGRRGGGSSGCIVKAIVVLRIRYELDTTVTLCKFVTSYMYDLHASQFLLAVV